MGERKKKTKQNKPNPLFILVVTSVLLLEIGEKSILIYNKRKNRGKERNGEKKNQ